jgi:hypothetical protein
VFERLDAGTWTNAVIYGAITVITGFAAMVAIMKIAKSFETAGSLIVLGTARYIVLTGLAMMLLGVSYMLVIAFLTK